MAATPKWKVYRGSEYIGCCKYIEDAAALVAFSGEDSSIRDGHRVADIMWHEGSEDSSASDSYDHVAALVTERARTRKFKLSAA